MFMEVDTHTHTHNAQLQEYSKRQPKSRHVASRISISSDADSSVSTGLLSGSPSVHLSLPAVRRQ